MSRWEHPPSWPEQALQWLAELTLRDFLELVILGFLAGLVFSIIWSAA